MFWSVTGRGEGATPPLLFSDVGTGPGPESSPHREQIIAGRWSAAQVRPLAKEVR